MPTKAHLSPMKLLRLLPPPNYSNLSAICYLQLSAICYLQPTFPKKHVGSCQAHLSCTFIHLPFHNWTCLLYIIADSPEPDPCHWCICFNNDVWVSLDSNKNHKKILLDHTRGPRILLLCSQHWLIGCFQEVYKQSMKTTAQHLTVKTIDTSEVEHGDSTWHSRRITFARYIHREHTVLSYISQ